MLNIIFKFNIRWLRVFQGGLSKKNMTLYVGNFERNESFYYGIFPSGISGGKYESYGHNWLNSSNCQINWNNNNLTANFDINETGLIESWRNYNYVDYLKNNKEIETSSGTKVKTQKILKANLYMRVDLIYKFYDNNQNLIETFTNLVYIDDLGISEEEIKGVELPLSKEQYDFVNVSARISETKCSAIKIAPNVDLNNFISFQGDYLIETEQSGTRIRDKSDLHKDNDKVIINNDSNKIEFTDSSGNYEEAFIDEINKDMTLTINGETFTKSLDIKEVALILHEVKKVDGINDAKLTLDNIAEAMILPIFWTTN